MRKYVIKLNGYVHDIFIVPDNDSEGIICTVQNESKEAAMTFRRKYLAEAIAKALGGEVEETKHETAR